MLFYGAQRNRSQSWWHTTLSNPSLHLRGTASLYHWRSLYRISSTFVMLYAVFISVGALAGAGFRICCPCIRSPSRRINVRAELVRWI
ncbi:hypothetical protein B0H12DRAFT_594109 [Mycena haematopus]|nr:hypothetical protein B0H12DRAFT_594109 [Mycena haematopus]